MVLPKVFISLYAISHEDTSATKLSYYFGQNYPNPANQSTRINYSVPTNALLEMSLFDMQGRKLKVLVNGMKEAGSYTYDLITGNLAKGNLLLSDAFRLIFHQ